MSDDICAEMAGEVAKRLAAKQDHLIRSATYARLGELPSDAELISRLRWELQRGHPEKMLLLDDKPLLLIWPPESTTAPDGAFTRIRWAQRFIPQ